MCISDRHHPHLWRLERYASAPRVLSHGRLRLHADPARRGVVHHRAPVCRAGAALLYLDDFDHWLRDDLGLVYGRYMDDFYIVSSDKLLLREILKRIEEYIKPLGLRLNGKTQDVYKRQPFSAMRGARYWTPSASGWMSTGWKDPRQRRPCASP